MTTRPDKGRGGRLNLVRRRFETSEPNRLHAVGITYVRLAGGRFAYTAFVTDVFARRIVGWAVSDTMDTCGLTLWALEQAINWVQRHGGVASRIRHSDHGVRYISTVCTTRVTEYGMFPSMVTIRDSYGNAMAESVNSVYKTELICVNNPHRTVDELEAATLRWVSCGTRNASTPLWATGYLRTWRTSIINHRWHKSSHNKGGTKTSPVQSALSDKCGLILSENGMRCPIRHRKRLWRPAGRLIYGTFRGSAKCQVAYMWHSKRDMPSMAVGIARLVLGFSVFRCHR